MKAALVVFFCICSFLVQAQPYAGAGKVLVKEKPTKAAQCTPPTTSTYMELNNVRILVHTAGNLWQNQIKIIRNTRFRKTLESWLFLLLRFG